MNYYKLADFISLRKGKKQSECLNSDDNAVRYIQIDDLRNDDNLKFTNDEKKVLINEKDVLIAWDGANAGTIGFNLNGSIGSTITAIKINEDFSNKVSAIYLGLFLRSKEKYLRERATGATIPHIQKDSLLELLLPLPSLSTQTQIAKILDKSTALIAKRKAQIAELDTLVQSVFLEMFNEEHKEFRKEKWENIFNTRTGKLDANAMTENGKYPFFTCSKDIFAIDEYAFDCEALLLAGNNATAKYDVKHYSGKFNAYQRTYVLTLKERFHSYVFFKVALENKLDFLKSQSKGTNTKYLTLSMLNNLEFLIPNDNEITRFSLIYEKIQTQKSQLQQSLAELEMQHQALMQRAFRGELV